MTTKDRLLAKLEEFHGYLGQLKDASKASWEDYLRDLMFKRGVERTLQLAVEAAIDIGNILISMNKWRAPATNRDVLRVLVEQGILTTGLGQSLEKLVGFRNILVHDYAKLDDAVVFGVLHGQLEGFEQFVGTVRGRIARLPQ